MVYKEKMVGTERRSLEYKQVFSSWSLLQLHLSFAWFFLFLMITLFYFYQQALPPIIKPPPSQLCWTILLEYQSTLMTKLVLGSCKDESNEWDSIVKYLWIRTTLYENSSHYGTPIQFSSNFPHKYTTCWSIIGFF